MVIFQGLLLFILFLIELAALVAFGYWGFHIGKGWFLSFALGIGVPLLVAVFWGVFVAPKASFPVTELIRYLLQIMVFSLASVALYFSGQKNLAIGFLFVALIDASLVYMMKL